MYRRCIADVSPVTAVRRSKSDRFNTAKRRRQRVTEDSPRIAFYIPSFERGGIERLVINIAPELLDRGIAVDVLVRTTDPPIRQLDGRVNIVRMESLPRLYPLFERLLPRQVAKAVAAFPSYLQYLVRTNPDLVVSLQINPFSVLGARLATVDVPVVVRESNTPSAATNDATHPISRISPAVKRLVYPFAAGIIAVSEDAGQDIAEFVNVPTDRITTIYNPTYNEAVIERARESADHPWFDDEIPIITSVGRFADQKDFQTLLRAFDELLETHRARLVLVGDGDRRKDLESLADRLGITDSVAFVGYQENPYKYVARSDVFVLSSHYEGLPNVVIEALTVGTPVVATDCPSGPREILLDGDGGKLVPVGDATAMRDALAATLDDPEQARRELAAAWEEIDRFRPENAAEAYIRLLNNAD